MADSETLERGAAATSAGTILAISASPAEASRTERLTDYVLQAVGEGLIKKHLHLRTLPADSLVKAKVEHPDIAEALKMVDEASLVVIATPTYKASYSGLLKIFLDVLPQYGLRGKSVLPIAVGGTMAHMQMLDLCLRPVLQSMWPRHIGQGCFLLSQDIAFDDDGGIKLEGPGALLLQEVIAAFRAIAVE